MMRHKIFLFGDSITEESFSDGGWGASLADLLRRKADIVLRGYSGYNTRWALKVVERVFPAAEEDGGESPAAVTVFFGANDACLPERCSGFQHVPLLEYKQNLRSLVSFLKVTMKKILETYKGFEGLSSLVDVGGGIGATLKMIVSKYPNLKGINFDLPHVINRA